MVCYNLVCISYNDHPKWFRISNLLFLLVQLVNAYEHSLVPMGCDFCQNVPPQFQDPFTKVSGLLQVYGVMMQK